MTFENHSIKLDFLRAKCEGVIAGLEKMESRNSHALLSEEFAIEYNNLLDLFTSTVSEIAPLLPPRAEIKKYGGGDGAFCHTMPSELLVYYNQLLRLFDIAMEIDK